MKQIEEIAKYAYNFWLQTNKLSKLSISEKKFLKQCGLTSFKSSASTIDQGDLFSILTNAYEKTLECTESKKNGIVYTPKWLSSHIVGNAVDQWQKVHRGGRQPKIVADVSCGIGVFLTELHKQITRAQWDCRILGFDKDNRALKLAKLYSWATGSKFELEQKDTLNLGSDLFSNPFPTERFDIIVGNPPYVRSQNLDREYLAYLRSHYLSAKKGAFDLSAVFVEKIFCLLNDGGIASLILTNKFMSASYGKELCRLLASQYRIISIEDFHDIQLFPGFTTYTCILTAAKLKPAKRFILKKHFEPINFSNPKLSGFHLETVPYEALKNHPWNLVSGIEGQIIRQCSKSKNPLLVEVFDGAYQGIRTGANDLFILEKNKVSNYESEYLKPFVTAENIGGIRLPKIDKFLIYPYKNNSGNISRLDESYFKKDAPKIYKYLSGHRSTLSNRSLQAGSAWYEFSRGQNLNTINRKKILIKEMMPFADFSVDLAGEVAFAAGYALNAESMPDKYIIAWATVLCTPVMEFMLRHHGTQLHSGWFRLMKQHLSKVRLPSLSSNDLLEVSNIVENGKISFVNKLKAINKIVSDTFELDNSHTTYIEKYLKEIHKRSVPRKSSKKRSEEIHDRFEPVRLAKYNHLHVDREDLRHLVTFVPNKGVPIHGWYKYTQGFSADLVNALLDELNIQLRQRVLDPFNGCGTTTATCAYRGVASVGLEISPLMCGVARIKARRWSVERLQQFRRSLQKKTFQRYESKQRELVFIDYIRKAYAPNIANQLMQLGQFVNNLPNGQEKDLCTISFLSILENVSLVRKHGSHYRYLNKSSSIGLQKLNITVVPSDTDIFEVFMNKLSEVLNDIAITGGVPQRKASVKCCDARKSGLKANYVDLVITSPPYLNRNNYIAQQKAELDFLNLISTKEEYIRLIKSTFRSHTDSKLNTEGHSNIKQVQTIVNCIRLEDGNNPKIPHMICGYFDDLRDMLVELHRILKPGGKAAFVVGNARWGGIVVPVDHLLLMLAETVGFKPEKVMVTRLKGNSPQQMRKYGRIPVRESIVVFSKQGY